MVYPIIYKVSMDFATQHRCFPPKIPPLQPGESRHWLGAVPGPGWDFHQIRWGKSVEKYGFFLFFLWKIEPGKSENLIYLMVKNPWFLVMIFPTEPIHWENVGKYDENPFQIQIHGDVNPWANMENDPTFLSISKLVKKHRTLYWTFGKMMIIRL